MPTDVPKACGVLIYRRRPTLSFLLMKHPDRWDLPKGHVDPGESNHQCALRELVEETGIGQHDIRLDDQFEYRHQYEVNQKRYGKKPVLKTLILYLAELVNDVEIVPTEHDGFQWFPWAPPHKIQTKTIDGLLEQLAKHWASYPVNDEH